MAARSVCSKMKSSFVLLTLLSMPLAMPSLAIAQSQKAPIRIVKAPSAPLPRAEELFDNLFAPYEAARTFRGKFDVVVQGEQNSISEIHLDTLFRYDEKGNLDGQRSTFQVIGRVKPRVSQTFVFSDEGESQKVAIVDQKAWWIPLSHDKNLVLVSIIKPLVEQVVEGLASNDKFVPVVSRGIEAGRPVLILKAKNSNVFRAVIDEQTRAIRSLRVKDSIAIDATNQSFNAPLSDEELSWSAPADYRQVAPGEVVPPASLGITIPGVAATPTG